MPYIKQRNRDVFDPILQALWESLVFISGEEKATVDQMKGNVNYCFTKILVTMLKKFGTRYHNLSNIKGIPDDVKEEFARIFMHPYEDHKREENGKVLPLEI